MRGSASERLTFGVGEVVAGCKEVGGGVCSFEGGGVGFNVGWR